MGSIVFQVGDELLVANVVEGHCSAPLNRLTTKTIKLSLQARIEELRAKSEMTRSPEVVAPTAVPVHRELAHASNRVFEKNQGSAVERARGVGISRVMYEAPVDDQWGEEFEI